MSKRLAIALLTAAAALARGAEADFTRETPEQKAARMTWFREARFGVMFTWGLYSVAAGEFGGQVVPGPGEWIQETGKIKASDYEKLAAQFNPAKFDARAWAKAAKAAGARYLVFTAKHHDGFAMWRSASAPAWSISATPYKGDPVMELAEACRAEGLVFGVAYSIMDWHHPDGGVRRAWNDRASGTPDMARYAAFMKAQLKELLGGDHGKIGLLWFDGEEEAPWTHARGVDLYNYVRGLQPGIVINNRIGKGRKGLDGMDKGPGVGDYGTPEQQIPAAAFEPGVAWEACVTMNNTWGFRKDDTAWKPAGALLRQLAECAGKGGNYLLNVGPAGDGAIPAECASRLKTIGDWMKVYGGTIQGLSPGPFRNLEFSGYCTARGRTLYMGVLQAPADGALRLAGLQSGVQRAYRFADPQKTPLALRRDGGAPVVVLPAALRDPEVTVVAAELDGEPRVETVARPAADGSITLEAVLARVEGVQVAHYEWRTNRNDIGYWKDLRDRVVWDVEFTQPGRYLVMMGYACGKDCGGEIKVTVDDQVLRRPVAVTGDWGAFTEARLGYINLTRPGRMQAVAVPLSVRGGGVANLQSLRLIPAP